MISKEKFKKLKGCFNKNTKSSEFYKERDEKIKTFVEFHMPGARYLDCKESWAATRYVVGVNPQNINLYQGSKFEKQVVAYFDVNNCSVRQDGAKLIIEVPNINREIFRFRDAFDTIKTFNYTKDGVIKAYAGEFISGQPAIVNFEETSHLLIAGATNSGKSVSVHNLILSMLAAYNEKELLMYLVDGKDMELHGYKGIPNVIEETGSKSDGARITSDVIKEMERRQGVLRSAGGYRSIKSYNEDMPEDKRLPEIIIVLEEIDVLFQKSGREDLVVENLYRNTIKLVKDGRSVGIHMILTSQRPSSNNMGTDIRSQLSGRIALKVESAEDSRMVLGSKHAMNLSGKGDALWKCADGTLDRLMTAWINDKELRNAQKVLKE